MIAYCLPSHNAATYDFIYTHTEFKLTSSHTCCLYKVSGRCPNYKALCVLKGVYTCSCRHTQVCQRIRTLTLNTRRHATYLDVTSCTPSVDYDAALTLAGTDVTVGRVNVHKLFLPQPRRSIQQYFPYWISFIFITQGVSKYSN